MRVDIHQHLWPEPLIRALSHRTEAPRLRRRGDGWWLELAGEPEAPFDPAGHDPEARAQLVRTDGLDRALVAPSWPIGMEGLHDAYHDGVAALPGCFGGWATAPRRLGERFVGVCLPATELAGPEGYDRHGPALEELGRRGAPLLVHPGTARAKERPAWWAALTDYVGQMHAAWHAFAVWGRPAHPALRVCFGMLAGLAPLQSERLAARGGRAATDPGVFLDTSSYGTRAVDAILREVGVDQLVHGSDRPVIPPRELGLGAAVRVALRERNPARLLGAVA